MITQHTRNHYTITTPEVEAGEKQYVLILSDVHFDSTKCDREMLIKHLDQAKERGAKVFLNGDFLDLMGGKYDPRNTLPGGLRPEYRGQDYFDLVTADAVEFLEPYKDLLTVYAQGNHETNVKKRQHTDLSKRVVEGLQAIGSPIQLGGYSGYIRWQYLYTTECKSYMMHYHHGYGGNAPRSKGVLHADIDAAKFPDADVIVRGHDHNKWHLPITTERITQKMVVTRSTVHHIRCGSYKKLGDGYSGWEVEKGFSQPRLGGWWWYCMKQGRTWETGVEEAH
jgi:UDP-2,3-diacylglucosamine pyrophosphatase LpxH